MGDPAHDRQDVGAGHRSELVKSARGASLQRRTGGEITVRIYKPVQSQDLNNDLDHPWVSTKQEEVTVTAHIISIPYRPSSTEDRTNICLRKKVSPVRSATRFPELH